MEIKLYKSKIIKWLYHIAPFGMLFLSWEIFARTISTPDFPPFSTVAASVFSSFMAYHLGITLILSLLGLLVISLVGLPLGMIIQRSEKAKWSLNPFLWFLAFAIGIGYTTTKARLIVLLGLSQLTIFMQSILLPILVVALISGYGYRMIAVRMGFLLCWILRIVGEGTVGATTIGIGFHLFHLHYLHKMEMVYAIVLLIGFTGIFVEEILIKYAGNIIAGKWEKYLKPNRP